MSEMQGTTRGAWAPSSRRSAETSSTKRGRKGAGLPHTDHCCNGGVQTQRAQQRRQRSLEAQCQLRSQLAGVGGEGVEPARKFKF